MTAIMDYLTNTIWSTLPLEILRRIAEGSGVAARLFWYYSPRFRVGFDPSAHVELFVKRIIRPNYRSTKIFGMLHSIDDAPAIIMQLSKECGLLFSWYHRGTQYRNNGPSFASITVMEWNNGYNYNNQIQRGTVHADYVTAVALYGL